MFVSATDFFSQLKVFSERVFESMGIKERESQWTYGLFPSGSPVGAILHFTAGDSIYGAARWFMQKAFESKASAQVIVGRGWVEKAREHAKDLELVRSLPCMVLQCLPPTHTAWHAGSWWFNHRHYGIEIVNPGEIRKGPDGGWVTWPNDWTTKYEPHEPIVEASGRFWEPYHPDQFLTVVEILRRRRELYRTQIDPTQIVGHEQIRSAKTDPGPLFPVEDIRKAVFEAADIKVYRWFELYSLDRLYMPKLRDAWVREWVAQEFAGKVVANPWQEFDMTLNLHLLKVGTEFGALGKLGLRMLGYRVSDGGELSEIDRSSVKLFQRMADIQVDGDPGLQTRKALIHRLSQWEYWH